MNKTTGIVMLASALMCTFSSIAFASPCDNAILKFEREERTPNTELYVNITPTKGTVRPTYIVLTTPNTILTALASSARSTGGHAAGTIEVTDGHRPVQFKATIKYSFEKTYLFDSVCKPKYTIVSEPSKERGEVKVTAITVGEGVGWSIKVDLIQY